MQSFLLFIVIIVTSLSCSDTNFDNEETIIGIYCGECVGNCFQGYIIIGDSVTKLSAKYFDQLENNSKTKISVEEKNQVKNLLKFLPSNVEKYKGAIGCPDCHDQCGIYLSLKNKGKTTTILIDPDKEKHPKEFEKFVAGTKNLKLL